MAQNRQGIEQLMEAEREAADIIATARLLKKQRKSQADQDALMEIDAYKGKKAQEFNAITSSGAGSQDDSLTALAADAKRVCDTLDSEFTANKDKTTDMLIGMVTNGLL
jgi:V-type H+-transporting ATPase subunit G|tara:strand:- start:666 stop:992 length:327 start_codon:yes stop_codon:yes gene_type:complete